MPYRTTPVLTPRSAHATERAYAEIHRQISAGRLGPGSPLREAALSRTIGVSRTPVRSALLRLHAEGLVEIVPHRGAYVATWGAEELEEILGLRVVLEGYGARLAATKITPPTIAAMRELADRMDDAVDRRARGYIDVCSRLNAEFHLTMIRAGENRRLVTLLSGLYEQRLLHRTLSLYSLQQLRRAWVQHRELIEAMEARDADRAAIVVAAHLLAARAVLLRHHRPVEDGASADPEGAT